MQSPTSSYAALMKRKRRFLTSLPLGLLLLLLGGCTLSVGPSSSGGSSGQGISEQVQIDQDQNGATLVLASVTIHGKGPFTFAVDTGASTSLVETSLAQQFNLPPQGPPEQISGIGGVQEAIPVQIDDWSLGQIHLPKMTIASANIPGERQSSDLRGLLGSDLWSRFGKVTLDYSGNLLTVYKQIADEFLNTRLVALYPTHKMPAGYRAAS